MRKHRQDMLNGVIWKEILYFFFPVFFGALFQQLYNTVDAIVVGNFVGKQALGAVGGSTGTVINLLVGFVLGLSSGATIVIAQFYGKQDGEGVRKGVRSGMWLATVLGFVLTVFGLIYAQDILNLLNVPEDMMASAVLYMRVYFIGLVPSMVYNTGAGILRAVGDSKRPLYFLIASALTNIVLDVLFVAVFKWEVAGAAAATVLSQIVSCVMTMYVLAVTDSPIHFSMKDFGYDKEILMQILRIGLPTGIQSSLYSVANLFIQVGVNSFGTDTVAAYTAFGKIDALFWNYSGAIGTAVMTFVGQNFGAGNYKRVKSGFRVSLLLDLLGSALICGVCWTFGAALYRMFTPDGEVIAIGVQLLRYLCPFWMTFIGVEIFSSGIRACGDSLVPMLMTALGIGALRVIWILYYPGTTVFDTLRCYPISWIVTSTIFLLYYLQGGWMKRSLAQRARLMKEKA